MAPDSGHAKVCVVCGTDCSNKPRTKDPKGKYYCRECYVRAKTDHSHSAANAGGLSKSPPKPKPVAVAPADDDAGEFNILDDLVNEPPVVNAAARVCPHCGAGLASDAMLCTGCGYNLQTGQQLHVKTSKAKEKSNAAVAASAGLLFSPTIVGLVCMAFFGAFFAMARGNEPVALAYLGVQAIFGIVASILVIIAGFRESILYGIGCLLCFPVALYVAFGVNDNAYIKWLYGTALLSSGLGYLVMDSLPHQSF